MFGFDIAIAVFAALVVILLFAAIKTVPQGFNYTVERFGRYTKTLEPGLNLIIPFFDRIGAKLNMMEQVLDVPTQEVITKDNVSVRVNAVVYFRVIDPERAIIQVERFLEAISQLAQTTLRSVLGQHELDDMLSERDALNHDIQSILDRQTDAWGIKVSNVEIKHVEEATGSPSNEGLGLLAHVRKGLDHRSMGLHKLLQVHLTVAIEVAPLGFMAIGVNQQLQQIGKGRTPALPASS